MRKDGVSEISKIEQILLAFLKEKSDSIFVEFDRITDQDKYHLIADVEKSCKTYVIGALYQDFDGKLYGFEEKGKELKFNKNAVEFLIKHKNSIQIINYFFWAKFLEDINPPESTQLLLDKLELSTPARTDLSAFRNILLRYGTKQCFYCNRTLKETIHVDHFIPWAFIHDDNLWNFVLACPKCNIKKKDGIVKSKVNDVLSRNNQMAKFEELRELFNGYTEESYIKLIEYSIKQGYKEITMDKFFQ